MLTCINYYIIHFTAQRAFQYLTQGKCSKLVNMLDTPCLTCKFKCLKGIIVMVVFWNDYFVCCVTHDDVTFSWPLSLNNEHFGLIQCCNETYRKLVVILSWQTVHQYHHHHHDHHHYQYIKLHWLYSSGNPKKGRSQYLFSTQTTSPSLPLPRHIKL